MRTITCQHCGEAVQRPNKSKYCLKCTWAVRHPIALYARSKISNAVATGKLPRARTLICVDCGKQALDYDHRDYARPLDVEPVCRSCNKLRGPAHPYICEDY